MYEAKQNKEKVSRTISPHMKVTKSPCFRLKDNRMPIQTWPPGQKTQFTPQEDQLIVSLYGQGENNWKRIADQLPGRTPRQVRDRYNNYLVLCLPIRPWSQEEDATLMQMFQLYGNKWSKMQRHIPGRSAIQIKNRAIKLELIYSRKNTMGKPANFYSMTFSNSLALCAERGNLDVFNETFKDPKDQKWYDVLGQDVDVGDRTDAVDLWNYYLRYLSKKERKIALSKYRNNPSNFRPENSSNNRSNGAKSGKRYQAPP